MLIIISQSSMWQYIVCPINRPKPQNTQFTIPQNREKLQNFHIWGAEARMNPIIKTAASYFSVYQITE